MSKLDLSNQKAKRSWVESSMVETGENTAAIHNPQRVQMGWADGWITEESHSVKQSANSTRCLQMITHVPLNRAV
jgi:hypothetical protein